METVPELAVADADAATSAIYRSIMAHSGTGTPALIFRHFATFPGFLEWVWRAVGNEVESGRVLHHSLDAVARTPRVVLPSLGEEDITAAGVDAAGQALLGAILASYNRMNPVNYSLIAAVRELLAHPDSPAGEIAPLPPVSAPPPGACPPLPPPVALRDMPADLQQQLLALSAGIPATGMLIPTLYRHLAIWPELMRRLAPGIRAAIDRGAVAARTSELQAAMAPLIALVTAHACGRGMPPPPLEYPTAMVRTLDAFLVAIPQMIVVGAAIEAAMPPTATQRRGSIS